MFCLFRCYLEHLCLSFGSTRMLHEMLAFNVIINASGLGLCSALSFLSVPTGLRSISLFYCLLLDLFSIFVIPFLKIGYFTQQF